MSVLDGVAPSNLDVVGPLAAATVSVRTDEDVLACFVATCADAFALTCRLVGGDRDSAETIMIDVLRTLRRTVATAGAVHVDRGWIVATALRHITERRIAPAAGELAALDRAVLELHLVDDQDVDEIATLLGLAPTDVIDSFRNGMGALGDPGLAATAERSDLDARGDRADVRMQLARSERWLDDATRRRVRAALLRDDRPITPTPGANHADPPDSAPRPGHQPHARRSPIVATCAAVAVIAAAIVWLRPGDAPIDVAAPDRANSSSVRLLRTEPQQSDGPVVATAPPRERVQPPGFILADPPAGFHSEGADEMTADEPVGMFQLWADPGARRTLGRWLALAISVDGPVTPIVADPSRVAIGIHPAVSAPALITTASDGIVTITVQVRDGRQFSMTGMGFSESALRRHAASLVLVADAPGPDPAVGDLLGTPLGNLFGDDASIVTLPSETGTLVSQLTGGERRTSSLASADGSQHLTVTTRPTAPDDLLLTELLLPASADTLAPVAPRRTIQMGDRELTVSALPTAAPTGAASNAPAEFVEQWVQWHEGSDTITISGNVGLYVLLGAVPSVRRATVAEWEALYRSVTPTVAGSD